MTWLCMWVFFFFFFSPSKKMKVSIPIPCSYHATLKMRVRRAFTSLLVSPHGPLCCAQRTTTTTTVHDNSNNSNSGCSNSNDNDQKEPSTSSAPFSLIDVMGDGDGSFMEHSASPSSSGEAAMPTSYATYRNQSRRKREPSSPHAKPEEKAADAWVQELRPSDAIRKAVRSAVLDPLKEEENEEEEKGMHKTSTGRGDDDSRAASFASMYKVHTADRFGMPADLPRGAPQSLEDLSELSPDILRSQLEAWVRRRRWKALSPIQQATIPFILEYRDVLCIAPTATGKTFSYLYPTMLRLLLDDVNGQRSMGPSDSGEEEPDLNRRDVEALLQDQINKGDVCRYCELRIAGNPLCPMTGVPHPPPPEDETGGGKNLRRAMRLEDLSSTAEPRVLILVPTAQLAQQVYGVCRNFHCDYTIRSMVRASSAEEQKKFLNALRGTDVLISTPETILPALYKHRLSLKRVKTLILDEVDDIVSVNHYEPLKIILGALPKGPDRPQRLLFGASLPPVVYEMLRDKMLAPSHRFILGDVKTDKLGHPVTAAAGSTPSLADGRTLVTANALITHIVFMVGRVEKIQALASLYNSGKLTADQRTIIFCNSRHNVAFVHDRLVKLVPDINITTLTARSSATARDGVLKMFAKGASTCLICTDVLSRGIDFRNVVYVVNYDMPSEFETWIHRSGRCGRNGLPGYTYTFFQPENIRMAKPLVAHLRQHKQLIPPKLHEYAKQSFVDVFKNSLFHHPTRPVRKDDPQNSTPVLGRGTPRFPDYRQDGTHKHFRPL